MVIREQLMEEKSSLCDSRVRVELENIPTNHMEVQGELCKLFYKKWGSDALPIIRVVFYEFGKQIGRKIVADCRSNDFKILCFSYLAPAMKRSHEAKLLDVNENSMTIRTTDCPWNLKNYGRELCEAMMEMDRGILDIIGNGNFKSELTKTAAEGDEYCEAVIRKIP